MIEESLEKLPATQPSRSCTIIRYNYEQIERDGVQLWQTNSVFLFSDTDIKKVPIGIVGEINLSNQSLSEAEIDAILRYFYSYRDQFRTPYPMINIGGSNASPSGDSFNRTPRLYYSNYLFTPPGTREALCDRLYNHPFQNPKRNLSLKTVSGTRYARRSVFRFRWSGW